MPWAGGRKVWHDDIFLLEKQARTWQRVGHLPRALAYGVSVTLQEGVLCAGGSDAQTHVRETWLFTWRKGDLQSRSLPDLPEPVANACGVARGRTVYLAGGSASPEATQAYRKMWRLDLQRPHPSWVEMEPWPGPARMLAMAAVSQGSVIVCGGVELQPGEDGKPVRRYLRDAYQFTPRRGWRRLADLPRPIAAAPSPAPVTRQGDVLILGGDDGSLVHFEPKAAHPGFRAEVLRYDRQRDLWREVGTVPAPRVTQPTVEWSGTWVLPSGEMRPGVRSPEVWSLRLPRND